MLTSALKGSAETINRLQALGKNVYFVTNNSSRQQSYLVDKAHQLNFNIPPSHVITSATAAANYLKKRNFTKKVYLIGRPGLEYELNKEGIRCTDVAKDEPKSSHIADITPETMELDPEVGAVLVNYDPKFTYGKLIKAVNYLRDPDCLFLSAGIDDTLPNPFGLILPGFTPVVRAIETLASQKVHVMGKPSRTICDQLFENPNFNAKRTLMIGDSAQSDIMLGKNCGFQTLLVGSGIQTFDDIQQWQNSSNENEQILVPDYYLPTLGDLLPFL